MGLDQWAYARKNGENIELMYWRKHANLEGWMADVYYNRGGELEFNCIELKLSREDILSLEEEHNLLDKQTGFFWGESYDNDIKDTQTFIEKALVKLDEGYDIIYTSWW